MADISACLAGKLRIIKTAIWDKQHVDLCGPGPPKSRLNATSPTLASTTKGTGR